MSERPYLNFDLQIEKSDAGYHVRVLDSPAGQAASEATLPFSDLEMENFLLKLGQKTRGTRRLESNQLEGIREFGAKLFQSMISGEVGGAYRSSVTLADRDGAGLRIRLRLSAAPDLIHIPWEFLFDPVARRFVALSVDSPIVRFLDIPGPTRPFVVEPPIKVLVIISSPSDFAPLQVENEWSRLKDAVRDIEGRGLIALERLETPTLTELQRALRRTYHVLHFIGHGGFDDQGQDGVLVFEDERGRGAEVSATYLSTLLHDADSLRLAVLNACDGAVSSRVDQFAGVAQSLLQQGVPAVVAMQFEITDDAAITFAHEFYGAFADGYSVEASLAEARKSIFAGQNDFEWATPVVYLRSVAGPIFKISPVATPPVPPAPVPEPVPDEPEPEPIPITDGTRGGQGGGDDGGGGGKPPPWWRRFGLSRSRTAVGLGGLGLAVVVAAVALIGLRGGGGDAGGGTPEATPTPYQTNFTGTWWTNSARVELNDSNGLVTGTYYLYLGDNQPHQLAGASNGRELSGSFDGPNNYFYFERTDENTLKGYWRDPNTGAEHQWCGRRGEQFLQADCGYSGDWRVKGLPAALELRTDVVQFSQTAGAAVLQFESRRYGVIQVAGKFDSATLAKVSGSTAAIQSNTRVPVYNVEWQLGEPDAKWDTIKGTWQAVSPATGSGEWCAWRPDASPPC